MNIPKGGKKLPNQVPSVLYGFRLFDKGILDNRIGFVYGRRTSGYLRLKISRAMFYQTEFPTKIEVYTETPEFYGSEQILVGKKNLFRSCTARFWRLSPILENEI